MLKTVITVFKKKEVKMQLTLSDLVPPTPSWYISPGSILAVLKTMQTQMNQDLSELTRFSKDCNSMGFSLNRTSWYIQSVASMIETLENCNV